MKKYPKPWWATHQVERESGVVEDVCKHGVGHPNKAWLKAHDGVAVHGCCGCCSLPDKEPVDGKVSK